MIRSRQSIDEVQGKIETAVRDWRQLLREWELQNETDPLGATGRLAERQTQRRVIEQHLAHLWMEKRLALLGEDVGLAHVILARLAERR